MTAPPPPGQRELLFNAVRPGTPASPLERTGMDLARLAFPWFVLLVIALCWDRAVYMHVRVADAAARHAMEDAWWYVTLRSLGTLVPWKGPWVGLTVVLLITDWRRAAEGLRDPFRRPVFLLLCPLLSGAAAELLKPLVGRFKPEETDGWFALASLPDRWHRWSDLGMASSHTAVACGGAFALSVLFPRGTPVFLAAGVGCGMTRLLAGGHFLSDVYVGIVLAFMVTRGIRALDRHNNRGVALGP